MVMCDFEVLSEELKRETKEGLVLVVVSLVFEMLWTCELHTRMRWESGFNFEVMWSAMLLSRMQD
jgi:hypothetical protein